jgi:hypothetical protein
LNDPYKISSYPFDEKEMSFILKTQKLLCSAYIRNTHFLIHLKKLKTDCLYEFNFIQFDNLIIEKYNNKNLYFEELIQNRFHPRNIYKFNSWGFECGIDENELNDESSI